MKRAAANTGRTMPPAAPITGRRLLALMALVAFLLQSMAVQTHVHPAGPQPFGPGATITAALPAHGPLNNVGTGPDACRLCQEMAHAGTYIAPAIVLPAIFLAITVWHRVAGDQPFLPTASSFIWQSRGPPAH